MNIWDELAELERKLNQLKRDNDRLFATNIEIRVNQLLIQERLEEIRIKNNLLMGIAES
jgi:hypothetical protein